MSNRIACLFMTGMVILTVPERPVVLAQANTQKAENAQTTGASGAFVNFNFDQVDIRFLSSWSATSPASGCD